MAGFSGLYGTENSMSKEIKSKTQIISWGKIGMRFSIQIEIIWSGKTVERFEKGIYNESFSTEEDTKKYEHFPKAEQ